MVMQITGSGQQNVKMEEQTGEVTLSDFKSFY
jgi:hypothetical protein